jgi:hypothetical protein
VLLTRYYQDEPLKEEEVGRVYGMHGNREICMEVFDGKT